MSESTIAGNKYAIDEARTRAERRVRAVLRRAYPSIRRVPGGPDNQATRKLLSEIVGPPVELSNSWLTIGNVGLDGGDGTLVEGGLSPSDLTQAMSDAIRLVRLVQDGVERHMAADDARTAITIAQYDACAIDG